MHSSYLGFQSKFAALSIALLLATLWLALHGYHGLTGDGQIYAFQAYARLYPQLAADLYLQNTSQDQFTVFSPLYAACIGILGLEGAARVLTIFFTLWVLAAAWSFARAIAGSHAAFLSVALLLIISGDYGGSRVFQILDPFLTARLPAEAMIITALACHISGSKKIAVLLALGALFVHPLMALPGLLLIIYLWLPLRTCIIAAIGGILATLLIALIADNAILTSPILTIMDAAWLHITRERSEFLFLHLWSLRDWSINAQPVVYLVFTALAIEDKRLRRLCLASALVAISGLVIALIGGMVGPVAILVQGQTWRWVWIGVFVSVVVVPFTAMQVWRDEKCGPFCALLLVSGWILPDGIGTACASLALIVWLNRSHIRTATGAHLRWAAAALCIAAAAWSLTKGWNFAQPYLPLTASSGAIQPRDLSAFRVPAALLSALVWWLSRPSRGAWASPLLSAALIALSTLTFPWAFAQAHTLAAWEDIHEFANWGNVIPPTSTVLVAPPRDVGAFVWFTLARPNYLTLNQSAGVVFSRKTALEVQRRSQVLLPLMDPDWNIWTKLHTRPNSTSKSAPTRPLTLGNLAQVCADPQLGFVISPSLSGFESLPHEQPGAWKNWSLYDCHKVRSVQPDT
jgi:hypothetical protein